MLYHIWRDHAGGAQTPEEFVSFLADLSAEVFQTTGESGLDVLQACAGGGEQGFTLFGA